MFLSDIKTIVNLIENIVEPELFRNVLTYSTELVSFPHYVLHMDFILLANQTRF